MSSIKPDQFQKPEPRPISEIAKDILQYPMESDPSQPFDSSQRVAQGDWKHETLSEALKSTAHLCATMGVRKSLVQKKIARSEETMNKLLDALEDMAHTNRYTDEQRQTIGKFALPLLELVAREHEELAGQSERSQESGESAEMDMKFNKARKLMGKPTMDFQSSEEDASSQAYFYRITDHIRGNARKLVEELGAAMKVDLESKVSLT